MALLKITFEPPEEGASSSVMHLDEDATVVKPSAMTAGNPSGRVPASSLEVGDEIRTVPQAPWTARIQLIEPAGA